jgi:hypothetical protein
MKVQNDGFPINQRKKETGIFFPILWEGISPCRSMAESAFLQVFTVNQRSLKKGSTGIITIKMQLI